MNAIIQCKSVCNIVSVYIIDTFSEMVASTESKPAGFQRPPISNPCLSYWQRTTRAFPLLNVNSELKVPETSKYVIIGSGLSGGLTAFELIEGGVKGSDIVILEAREAAGGASSRNAGHVRPGKFICDNCFSMLSLVLRQWY